MNIQSPSHSIEKSSSGENDLEKDSSAENLDSEKMPLYPHSILKKASKNTSYPQYAKEEPVIDYDTEDEDRKEDIEKDTWGIEKSNISNEGPSLDRPAAKPGKTLC